MIIGTNHFISLSDAMRYYSGHVFTDLSATINNKIKEGEIAIGRPAVKPGQTILQNKNEGRYFIQE